jgi:hypothetical protein
MMTSEKKSKPKPAERQRGARDQEQTPAPEQPAAAAPAWRERAAFHVTFDHQTVADGVTSWLTRAYHEETGDEQARPGILAEDLLTWMRERAGLPGEAARAGAAAEPDKPAAPAEQAGMQQTREAAEGLRLSAGPLEVLELPAERQAGGEDTAKRLRARLSFELGGASAYLATADMAGYAVEVLALDCATAETARLASCRRELRPEHLSYAETLDFDMPEVGSYQLIANVVLFDSGAAGVALGPVLNIVP